MINFPWPAKELNPNVRVHWAVKARVTKKTRADAMLLTRVIGEKVLHDGLINVHITFYPPDRRKRDEDGMISSCKAILDGLADGLKVNDNRFRLHPSVGMPVTNGMVQVEIKQVAA